MRRCNQMDYSWPHGPVSGEQICFIGPAVLMQFCGDDDGLGKGGYDVMKWKREGLSDFRLRLAQDLEHEIGSSRDGRRFALWRGFCCSLVLGTA